MEDSLIIFNEDDTEQIQKYLTNTVENPYEDKSVLLSAFYELIADKELTFGKLSGAYTEEKPVYAVLADEEHVATISFVSDETEVGYDLCGWKIHEISLLVSPTKSFAVTIPSSMNLTINGVPVAEEHKISTTETNAPVSYVNYVCNGKLFRTPEIQVTDRYGTVVELQKDEATGGLYYQLSYAMVPATMQLSFGGHVLTEEKILQENIPVEEMDFIPQVAKTFAEYAALPEIVNIPTFKKYYIDFAYEAETVTATDRFGTVRELSYDEASRTYSHELISNDSLKEECVERTTEFLEIYTLFCANDAEDSELKPFFPDNSEFYRKIIKMDSMWFDSHTKIKFSNHQLKEFFAYTDNLVYIYMTLDQQFDLRRNGKKMLITVDLPLWLVKMEEEWYVARIIFDNTGEE